MATALGTSHFKPPPRQPIAQLPGIARLGQGLAEAFTKGLSALRPGPWRVTFDGLDEIVAADPEADAMLLRFESDAGSLTCRMLLDRQAISALVEAAMGGTGAEAAFSMSERPLSRIEAGILGLARTSLGSELRAALADQLDRPFSLFEGGEIAALDLQGQGLAQFRFVVNVFSHSGEIRLSVARDELERQLNAASLHLEEEEAAAKRHLLQQQLGKSGVVLTVMLEPQMLPLEAITSLRLGQLVPLAATVTAPVTLWSGGVAAYQGALGRSGERLAVTITHPVT